MKKYLSKVLLAAFAVMLLSMSVLVGCGGSKLETIDDTVWKVTQFTMPDKAVASISEEAKAIASMLTPSVVNNMTVEFQNGVATVKLGGKTMSKVNYTYSNGKLTIEGQTFDVGSNSITINRDGGSMTLSLVEGQKPEKQTGYSSSYYNYYNNNGYYNGYNNGYYYTGDYDGEGAPDSLEDTKWEIDSISYNGESLDIATYAELTGVSADQLTIEFKDGKAIAGGDTSSAVDYTYVNGKVTIQGTTFTVNGDTMEAEQNGAKIVMKRI